VTATQIWTLCDGEHSVKDIVTQLSATYDTPADVLVADVRSTVAAFRRLGLLRRRPVREDNQMSASRQRQEARRNFVK
jgi:hypothetical protein